MKDCPVEDDSQGITLRSLGGVFIATLIGLGLALVTLAVEVVLQKRKEKKVGQKGRGASNSKRSATSSKMSKQDQSKKAAMKFRIGSKEMPAIVGND